MTPSPVCNDPKDRFAHANQTGDGVKRTVTILGSTGSVGINALRVIQDMSDRFEVAALAAGSQAALLVEQIEKFHPRNVYLKDAKLGQPLREKYRGRVTFFSEEEGLREFAKTADADILVAATNGTSALLAVMDAIELGKRVALANKEILVVAGGLVMEKLRQNPSASLIPVDSEHNAIFQCLEGRSADYVERLLLTGSGGPLREVEEQRFMSIPKETVTSHPKWKMGRKITVDSATLMNKGLEIIEASWLFGQPIDKIQVLIHPEAIVHSMVEFKDGAVLAQLGVTDMRVPIRHALCYPERLPCEAPLKLDFAGIGPLHFLAPDRKKFPCLDIAYQAALQSGSAPCVLSAADEVAVGAYLEDRIHFIEIPRVIESVLSNHRFVKDPDLSEIQSIHHWAMEETKRLCLAL